MDSKKLTSDFLALQEKIKDKRKKEKDKEAKREQEWDKEVKEKIKHFFEENGDMIVNQALADLKQKMEDDKFPPYELEQKIPTSLFFGCSRNKYNDISGAIVRKKLREVIPWNITVYVDIIDEEDWFKNKQGIYRNMYIRIFVSF